MPSRFSDKAIIFSALIDFYVWYCKIQESKMLKLAHAALRTKEETLVDETLSHKLSSIDRYLSIHRFFELLRSSSKSKDMRATLPDPTHGIIYSNAEDSVRRYQSSRHFHVRKEK